MSSKKIIRLKPSPSPKQLYKHSSRSPSIEKEEENTVVYGQTFPLMER